MTAIHHYITSFLILFYALGCVTSGRSHRNDTPKRAENELGERLSGKIVTEAAVKLGKKLKDASAKFAALQGQITIVSFENRTGKHLEVTKVQELISAELKKAGGFQYVANGKGVLKGNISSVETHAYLRYRIEVTLISRATSEYLWTGMEEITIAKK